MSVLDFGPGDHFVVTIKKNLLTNPEDSWVNRYEYEATAEGGATVLNALIQECLLFERAFHSAAVFFSQGTVSTWAVDNVPYQPDSFIVVPLSTVGLKVLAEDLQPLDKALRVKRVASSGRAGNLFYRGALYESEVSSPSGKSILTAPASMQTTIDTAMSSSEIEIRMGAAPTASPKMVMINSSGTQVRNVLNFVASGVSSIKTDHAWYNRTAP